MLGLPSRLGLGVLGSLLLGLGHCLGLGGSLLLRRLGLGSLLGCGLLLGLGLRGLPRCYLGLLSSLHLGLLRRDALTVSHNDLLLAREYNGRAVGVNDTPEERRREGAVAERIYIVEDDQALADELAHLLVLAGFEAMACDRFPEAAQEALAAEPDCVVVDLNLPGADGLEVCRDIRAASRVPIIVLTSSDSEFSEVMAMNLGADDYVTKPYRPAALIARIQAHVRRTAEAAAGAAVVRHEGVSLDVGTGMVAFEGAQAQLTRNEQRILMLLMANPGTVITRAEIMEELWESDAFIDDNTLTVNVNRLRRALESLGVPEGFVQTRRGVGYLVP